MLALGYSFDETGEAIGKSGNAVAERRYNGGLIPDQIIRSVVRSLLRSGPWSSGEDELLMLLTAHDWDSVRIAKVLSRSSASVESRKNDKGIRGHRCAAKQSRAGIWRACMTRWPSVEAAFAASAGSSMSSWRSFAACRSTSSSQGVSGGGSAGRCGPGPPSQGRPAAPAGLAESGVCPG